MENSDKSPIIERLCRFMEYSGLSNSQFADKARIPRPSLSQMLHGRNKSLNNQILAKLNSAYPELNIVWLLFGTGDMLTNANIEISQPQNGLFEPNFIEEFPEDEDVYNSETSISFNNQSTSNAQLPERKQASQPTSTSATSQKQQILPDSIISAPSNNDSKSASIAAELSAAASKDSARRVTSILVLYSDGSFETFTPSGE